MKVEQRTVYIAYDGSEFYSEKACCEHEAKLSLEYYFVNSTYYTYGELQLESLNDLKDFLSNGKEYILPFMGWVEKENVFDLLIRTKDTLEKVANDSLIGRNTIYELEDFISGIN